MSFGFVGSLRCYRLTKKAPLMFLPPLEEGFQEKIMVLPRRAKIDLRKPPDSVEQRIIERRSRRSQRESRGLGRVLQKEGLVGADLPGPAPAHRNSDPVFTHARHEAVM